MSTPVKTDSNLDRLYQKSVAAAKNAAGGERAFWIIGATLRQALVAQEILTTVAIQDDDVPAERVRALLNGLRDMLGDDESLAV